jgi:NADH dehydrogenase [ubiquinone] 1 alpha subcomplex assembly factor 5
MNVFDRKAKGLQRERASIRDDIEDFDYLKEEMGYRLADRVSDISRPMEVALDLGSGRGYVTRHLTGQTIKKLYALEMSSGQLDQCQLPPNEENIDCEKIQFNEDNQKLPFEDESVNLVTSSLSLHWVNNLPGLFKDVQRVLKKDGVFIGSMFGGETLFELRSSLQLAELEREGGFGSHISPFVDVQDLGNLLNRSGFNMLTIDTDEVKIAVPTVMQLMRDLKGMAENNASWSRKLRINKDTLIATNAIYQNLYGQDDGNLPATFQIYYWIGWKPDPSQPKSLKPQKSDVSLMDIYKLDEILQSTDPAKKKKE